jgi:hypothetical protein
MPYILPPRICLYVRASALRVRIVIVQDYAFRLFSPGANMITASVPSLSGEYK